MARSEARALTGLFALQPASAQRKAADDDDEHAENVTQLKKGDALLLIL